MCKTIEAKDFNTKVCSVKYVIFRRALILMELVRFIIVSYLGTPRICTRPGTSYVKAIYYERQQVM